MSKASSPTSPEPEHLYSGIPPLAVVIATNLSCSQALGDIPRQGSGEARASSPSPGFAGPRFPRRDQGHRAGALPAGITKRVDSSGQTWITVRILHRAGARASVAAQWRRSCSRIGGSPSSLTRAMLTGR